MNLYEAIKKANTKEIDSKQKFIDYCKGKIKKIQPVKIKGADTYGYSYREYEDENEPHTIRVDYISSDDYKALNSEDMAEYFSLENSYLSPKGNLVDGGEMDAGELNHLAELDFKYIDGDFYNELLDNWESWEMPMRFEDTDLNESGEFKLSKESEDNDTLKQMIKDEFGFDIKYLDYNSDEFAKHGNLNAFIRRCLQEAKDIGLDVDDISFGYPGVGDNYVGNHDSKIVITDDANGDGTLLRKELHNSSERSVDAISRALFNKPTYLDNGIDTAGNIHINKGDYSIQGIVDEFARIYYFGKDRKTALQLMQAFR